MNRFPTAPACAVSAGSPWLRPPLNTPARAAAPNVVYVQQQKRRFNPLWLVLILLFLLLSCCCLLMLLGLVDAPVIAAPIVEQARQFTPIQQRPVQEKDGPKEKPAVNCEKAAERLNAVDLNGFINCMPALNQCWTELVGLDDYKGVQLDYGWDGTVQGKAACGPNILNGGKQTCIFPMDPKSDRVDFWFSIKGDCRQHECWVGGMLPAQDAGGKGGAPLGCCANPEASNVIYRREPPEVGQLYLSFVLVCGQAGKPGECTPWEAWVGADRDILWTQGECCVKDEDPTLQYCKGAINDQKKSMTRIVSLDPDCPWEVEFQSPYYEPPAPEDGTTGGSSDDGCPSGQSMCGGSCCTDGHCSGGSCY